MAPEVDPLELVLEKLHRRAQQTNRARADVLGSALRAIGTGTLSEADQHGAQTAAHQLAGSAGTFGHAVASRRARDLEVFLDDPDPGRLDWARTVFGELEDDLAAAPERP